MRLEALIGADDLAEDSELDYPFAIPRLDQGRACPTSSRWRCGRRCSAT